MSEQELDEGSEETPEEETDSDGSDTEDTDSDGPDTEEPVEYKPKPLSDF